MGITDAGGIATSTAIWRNLTKSTTGTLTPSPYGWVAGNISLQAGTNNMSITASDRAGNTATKTFTIVYTATVTSTAERCVGIALDKVIGDNWFGIKNVQLVEGQQIKYCATLGRQASMLRFTAYDMSDRRCGSAEIRVRQIGNAGWSRNSGFSAAPGVTMAGTKLSGNPTLTAAGAYEVTLVGGHTNEGCTRFQIAWKAN